MIRISWMLVSRLAAARPTGTSYRHRAQFPHGSCRKTGVLAAAHEHWGDAPIAGGTIAADSSTPGVRFAVDAN
jgi:hypothetical protein